ncbi:plastoglobulin-1, chloroplastic-like [Cynara cardunculus var. scolymus]|uniref:plastoglobulin-1, chloroplastic-like n=1 Tax=Cynara cardunculus var. scolymus TaxID=59895 RepID=UPI000D62BB42|nr:plastoglobulin-1, chloroplastic-like [Cynara cardunculus var. scolymus]
MWSLIFSHSPSFLFPNSTATATGRSFATAPLSFSVSPSRNPRRIKSTIVRLSSNKPPITPGGSDEDGSEPPTVTDEWGEKSGLEPEPLTKLSSSDPPKDEDEWGTDDSEQSKTYSVTGNGSAVAESAGVEDNSKIEALKRCLVDSVYGTGLGFSASAEERAEVIELVTQLEGANPTSAPTDAVELLDGKWILLYTAFSELLPLLAVGTIPLLKVEKICQDVNTSSLTIDNSITFSTPFATFTSTALANFEVRSPSRIQVEFKEGSFQPPKIKSNVDLPENLDIFGQNINLSAVQQSLNPLQEAVANIAGVISGQAPLKIPIPGERSKSWLLITYLDKDLRISRGDGGLFVLAKEGSPLLDP